MKNLCQVLCILTVLVSFTNCQNDTASEMQEDALQNELPFKSSLVTKQNVDTNIKLSKKMTSLANIQTNSIAKNAHDGIYDFAVNTEVVKLIESTQNNTHSYTFPIEREQPTSEFENLVFTYNTNLDNYTASLVKYHFTTAQKQEFLLSGRIIGSSYDVSYEPIYLNLNDVIAKSAMPLPCTTNFTVYHITPDTGETFHHSTNGSVQNACQHEDDEEHGDCDTYTVIEIECPDGGSVAGATHDTGSHNTNNSSNNTTTGGNSNSNNSSSSSGINNNVVTSPIVSSELQETMNILNDVLGEGKWELAEDRSLEDAPNFESAEELEAYLASLVSSNFNFESSEIEVDISGETRKDTHKMEFSSFPNASIKATVKRKYYNGALTTMIGSDILNVRTRLQGNTTFYKWDQLDDENMSNTSSSPNVQVNTQSNSLKIEVDGEMEIGFRFFGEFFTTVRDITVVITYDIYSNQLEPEYSYWKYNDLD